MAFKQEEKVLLIVNGVNYADWESVMVRHALYETPFFRFRFTCSEPTSTGPQLNFAKMQILPGDICSVTLGGEPAIGGVVTTRQVFYDARRHYVEIQGASNVIALSGASFMTKTHEFKDITWPQLAQAGLKGVKPPIKLRVEGGQIPQLKFGRISIPLGTSVMDILDLHARPLGIALTSNPQGDLVAVMGPAGGSDTVTEGKDILEGREIIFNAGMEKGTYGVGYRPGNNDKYGAQANQQFHFSKQAGLANPNSLVVLPLEIPTWDKNHIVGRLNSEGGWQQEDAITVTVTVHGWSRAQSGGLWHIGQTVHVKSPMLIMDMDLTLKTVTFLQDNNIGSRSVLECCNQKALEQVAPQAT